MTFSSAAHKEVIIVVTTITKDHGSEFAHHLLQQRLAACINILSGVFSLFWWKNKIDETQEDLLIIKTSRKKLSALKKAFKELHPYEVPEFLVLSVSDGLDSYCNWVLQETSVL